jgi:hypothetical protein
VCLWLVGPSFRLGLTWLVGPSFRLGLTCFFMPGLENWPNQINPSPVSNNPRRGERESGDAAISSATATRRLTLHRRLPPPSAAFSPVRPPPSPPSPVARVRVRFVLSLDSTDKCSSSVDFPLPIRQRPCHHEARD